MDTEESVHCERMELTRRDFLKGVGIGGGALVLFGQFGVQSAAWALPGEPSLKMVLVDYAKCTGCRTCEAACSSRNRPASVGGKEVPGGDGDRFGLAGGEIYVKDLAVIPWLAAHLAPPKSAVPYQPVASWAAIFSGPRP